MASVAWEDVEKQFGTVVAVKDFTLNVEDREFLVLLGPSGCGKTTSLRMLAGLEQPTAGRISIGGREVTHLEAKDRDIAMVFQNYALYPHMSVYENMAFGLKLRHMPAADIKKSVTEVAELLGLASMLTRRPRELSGGQRQRVALGRAIVRNPQAFLMDEPLSNLDAKLRSQTRVQLKALQQRLNATTIYVTHDQTEAMTLASRIVVMNEGEIQQVGTPDTIYHRPANQFVASFVGTPGMNLLKGELHREGSVRIVELGGGSRVTLNTPELSASADRLTGRELILGVRPEDVHLEADARGLTVSARVQLVEPMGHENIVHMEMGDDQPLVSRTANAWSGAAGDQVQVVLDPDRLHLFDPATERVSRV